MKGLQGMSTYLRSGTLQHKSQSRVNARVGGVDTSYPALLCFLSMLSVIDLFNQCENWGHYDQIATVQLVESRGTSPSHMGQSKP
jgi:hypothetical protein